MIGKNENEGQDPSPVRQPGRGFCVQIGADIAPLIT
jgi:hypothetical protein